MDFYSVNYLTSKMQSWTQEIADEFHGPAPKAFLEKAKYIWEPANTDRFEGFVYYGPRLAAYLNANGEEYIMSAYIDADKFSYMWNLNSQLYNRSLSDSRFRIVQPLGFPNGFRPATYRTVTIDYETFNYYNLRHPDNDLGGLVYFDSDTNLDTVVENYIEQIDILASHLYDILGTSSPYPNVKTGDLVMNDTGLYWRFLYGCELNREGFYAKIVGELEKFVQHAVQNEYELTMALFYEGKDRWKNTLNI